ncbi:hypothetical protein ABHI18_012684 [Aspergillus niger]
MDSIDSILDAATILSRISDIDRENLLAHRAKLEAAFRNLKSLLKASDEIASGRSLLGFLERNEGTIREWFRNAGESDNKSEGDWVDEDPRIVDLSIVDQESSLDERFRAGLSAINLASTYMTWEQNRLKTVKRRRKTRVDALCDNLGAGNRSTFYKEYVDASDNFRDKEKAKNYIEYGVKSLVFGRMFVRHMQVYAGDMSTDVHLGVLGILFLTTYFRRVTYPNIPLLVNAILSSDWGKLAEEKTEWVSSRLKQNDDRIQRVLAHRGRKHDLEEENTYTHRNKRSRNEDIVAVISNNAALQYSLINPLEVDPLGLPFFDDTPGRNLNSTCSDEHPQSQEHIVQNYAQVDPLGRPHFRTSIPQNTPPLGLLNSPPAIPSDQLDAEVASFLANLRENGDSTSNGTGNTVACMV